MAGRHGGRGMRVVALLAVLLAPVSAWAQPEDKSAAPFGTWQPRGTAELSVLDKVRAQAVPLTVRIGGSGTAGSLTIAVRGCFVRPADQEADSAAFLDIADSKPSGREFHGWMLAGEPSLNQLQHPIYDVRVMSCH